VTLMADRVTAMAAVDWMTGSRNAYAAPVTAVQ